MRNEEEQGNVNTALSACEGGAKSEKIALRPRPLTRASHAAHRSCGASSYAPATGMSTMTTDAQSGAFSSGEELFLRLAQE
jgi:hypothetical protein